VTATAKDRVAAALTRARADLDQALADLDTLPALDPSTVAFAAHALNNYLTVTLGTLELLQLSLPASREDVTDKCLETLQQATSLMSHTVSQLMNASELMTASTPNGPRLKPAAIDLALLLRRVCAFYQRAADRKEIRIDYPEPGELPAAWADRVAVAAVLDNLLSNAIKYSRRGGRIEARAWREPAHVAVSVRDDGPGLSAEDQARLFQKGVRLGSVPTGDEPSAGYGLAVAHDLVQRMNGQIWCESQRGQGATFAVRLPLADPPGPSLVARPGLP
jgi:signal transduction histidine kinase